MTSAPITPNAAAQALTEFLTQKRDRYGATSPSIIEGYVQQRIQDMARDIAAVVVEQNPQLRETLHRMVQQTIAAALRDDAYLQKTVIDAVSKGLGRLVAEAEHESS